MKNKIIFVILLILIVCLSLCGCNKMFSRLNDLNKKPHDNVKLSVKLVGNGAELNGTYTAVKQADGSVSVAYSYQVLNEITTENGEYVIPQERISTYSGSMKVTSVNGETKVEMQDGDKPDLDLSQITAVSLNFDKSNLDNVVDKDGVFAADVKDLSTLMGGQITGQNARVVAKYVKDVIESVEISFKQGDYDAVFTYEFAV